jgi:hypothetical protein
VSEPDRLDRIERLLDERVAQAREALALQREALEAQKAALAESRELVTLHRANIERAAEVNQLAASVSRNARRLQLALIPVLVVLVGYVSWLLFFKLGVR